MKKILSLALVLVMVLSVAALVGCSGDKEPAGNDAATLKFGLGVVSSYGEAKDADGETNGQAEFNTTAVAVLLDAEGKTLGALAVEAAVLLRGKHKVDFAAHADCGDYVVIINAEKAVLTGNKLIQKKYYHHTGYVGHLKEVNYKTLMAKEETNALEREEQAPPLRF